MVMGGVMPYLVAHLTETFNAIIIAMSMTITASTGFRSHTNSLAGLGPAIRRLLYQWLV